ncbi:MAG: M23 family metallopeptidase [Endomicrobium sp.]|jgi:murein DD-endopeptidase MepM/ murein hydrolase activator NlpD|nr:M23 family metallopeptidase [Endomicrobium sp.]
MNKLNEIKTGSMRNIFFRWAVFIIFILAVFIAVKIIVVRKAAALKVSIPVVAAPDYTAEVLLNDVEARSKYLSTRVKDISFFVYSVKPKDNLWKIAKKYGYSVHTLIGHNPQLKTYNVDVTQKILVPSAGGSLHPVQNDDTWIKIAKRYDIAAETLQLVNFGIVKLIPGEYIFIPGRKPVVDLMNKEMQEKYELRSLFVSPLGGRLSSVFGKRVHPITGKVSLHGGIDIAVPAGTWVGAAADGKVILASHNVGHYGTAIFLDHKNGYITHYGHLSSIKVRVGQKVKARRLIAKSGASGRVTGPHLHFTIKKGDKALDPLKFLW